MNFSLRARSERSPAHPSLIHRAIVLLASALPALNRLETRFSHNPPPWAAASESFAGEVAASEEEATRAVTTMLAELRLGNAVAYSDGTLMAGTAGAVVAFRWLRRSWKAPPAPVLPSGGFKRTPAQQLPKGGKNLVSSSASTMHD